MSRMLLVVACVLAVLACVSLPRVMGVVVEENAAPNVAPGAAGMMAPAGGVQKDAAAGTTPAVKPETVKKNLTAAEEAVNAATKAVEEGKKDEALAQLKKAKEALAAAQKSLEPAATAKKAVNAKCPIMGNAVDPKTETREFRGQVVGFCCAACPAAWDKLSADEKAAKLKKAME